MKTKNFLIFALGLYLTACKPAPDAPTVAVAPDSRQTDSSPALSSQVIPKITQDINLPPAVSSEVLAQAKALVGIKGTLQAMMGPMSDGACINEGSGGAIAENGQLANSDAWSYGLINCSGNTVVILEKALSGEKENKVFHIVDALALPDPYALKGIPDENAKDPYPWLMSGSLNNDGCEIKDHPQGTPVFGMSRRKELPEVKLSQAWMFDLVHGRIVSIDPQRVTCTFDEP